MDCGGGDGCVGDGSAGSIVFIAAAVEARSRRRGKDGCAETVVPYKSAGGEDTGGEDGVACLGLGGAA